jgi:hypothetical protein
MSAPSSEGPEGATQPGEALASAARVVLLGLPVLGLGVVVLALRRFDSLRDPAALGWLALAIGLIALGVGGARLQPGRRIALALGIIAIGAVLVCAEVLLSVLPQMRLARIRSQVAAHTGRVFDTRSIPEVIRARRDSGQDIVPSIVPKVVSEYVGPPTAPATRFEADFFPLGGISARTTLQLCNEDGQYPSYRSDRYGFHNPSQVWEADAELVLIGDSFTHGYCVEDIDALAGQLRRRFPRTVNLGTGGSGPLAGLGTLKEYGLAARPKTVLWVFFENDLDDLARERRQPTLVQYLEPGFTQNLRDRQSTIDSTLAPWVDRLYASGSAPQETFASGWKDIATLSSIRRLVRSLRAPDTADPLLQVPLFSAVLRQAQELTSAQGAALVFVYLPRWERINGNSVEVFDTMRSMVLDSVHAMQIPTVDMTDTFAKAAKPAELFARSDIGVSHYSAAGYRLVAERVVRTLDSLATTRAQAERSRP